MRGDRRSANHPRPGHRARVSRRLPSRGGRLQALRPCRTGLSRGTCPGPRRRRGRSLPSSSLTRTQFGLDQAEAVDQLALDRRAAGHRRHLALRRRDLLVAVDEFGQMLAEQAVELERGRIARRTLASCGPSAASCAEIASTFGAASAGSARRLASSHASTCAGRTAGLAVASLTGGDDFLARENAERDQRADRRRE